MTLFEDDRYDWRETYFVYFESSLRPKLPEIRRAMQTYAPFFSILDSKAEANGNLVSMTIASYENHAALEITYREGNDVAAESEHLFRTLKKGASPEELVLLKKIDHCKNRLDVHHFEQTAGTSVFNVTKLPEIKFSRQTTFLADHGDVFLKALGQQTANKRKLHFDPNVYNQYSNDQEDIDDTNFQDSGEYERINPEMLVTVLEILCRLSRGVALDPASGIVLG
jgi:hypothetical protein